ncbi:MULTISPECIES: helix-turn-helix domain-containing protein [Thermomonospora]|nr:MULTISPECIES: Scr1 family TA system antitoxin-like transcriptional regulator [Thermomonospora]
MFLAQEIMRLRQAKGMNREQLAKMVFVSESLVRSWERGRRIPQPDHLEALEKIFDTKGVLLQIRKELINAATPMEWMAAWRAVESRATSLLSFETTVIPGLLQTKEYATSVFQAARHLGEIDEMLKARLERQKILTREDDPPTLVALLAEAALLNNVGGPKIMHDQLMHIAKMAERDHIVVQVIPFSSSVCAGFLAPFVIASFDAGEAAYVDNQLNGDVITETENVAILRRMFEQFRAEALSGSESVKLIQRLAEERWTEN